MTQPLHSVKPESNDRTSLRKKMIAKRREIDINDRTQWDEKISAHLLSWLNTEHQHRAHIGVYSPIKGEPNLSTAYQVMHHLGIQLALPIVIEKGQALQFSSWSPADKMKMDEYGIPIPVDLRFIAPEIVLVPCVGFNHQAYRLGYGGGFYDRSLALSPRPLAIGIAYQNLLLDFNAGPFDIPMDVLITEEGVFSKF
jgi:5-formyltetrahydrofolate cyclo-ligase